MQVEQISMAASIWSTAGPVVPTGKKRFGSESLHEARSRQSVVIVGVVVVSTKFPWVCDLFHKGRHGYPVSAEGLPPEFSDFNPFCKRVSRES